jgi:hypothetical protein
MLSRWPRACGYWLSALMVANVAHATDTLIGGIQGTHFPGEELGGYAVDLTWQHSGTNGGLLLGATDTKVPEGSLQVLDLDGYRLQWQHLSLSGGMSLGDAQTRNGSNLLYKARLAADSQINPNWSVRLADQYIDLNLLHGQLMDAAVEFRPTPHWGIRLAGGYSVSGTLADRYGQAVLNWYGATHIFGGIVAGRTGFDPATLGENAAVRQLREGYAGAALPMHWGSLNLSVDVLSLDGASRETLRLGFSIPLKP